VPVEGEESAVSDLKEELHRSLQASRAALLSKLDNLSEYDRRRPLTPTGTNLLGLVKHLARPEESSEYITGLYRRACAHADGVVAALGLEAPGSVAHWPQDRRDTTLGVLLIRMVAKTAQHLRRRPRVRQDVALTQAAR
jgi:hypothetical protein